MFIISRGRAGTLLFAAFALVGCTGDKEDFAGEVCEYMVQDAMKSPASFQLIETSIYPKGDDLSIYLKFDATHSYGTLLRGIAECSITLKCDKRAWNCLDLKDVTIDGKSWSKDRLSLQGTAASIRVADRGWFERLRYWSGL